MLLMMLIVLVNFLRMLSSMLIKMKRAELKYKARKVCLSCMTFVGQTAYAKCSSSMVRLMLKLKHKARRKKGRSRNEKLILEVVLLWDPVLYLYT